VFGLSVFDFIKKPGTSLSLPLKWCS